MIIDRSKLGVNKVLFHRLEKRTVASVADMFLIEALHTLKLTNLLAIMFEYMHKIMTIQDGKHGLSYGYLLIWVFKHLKIPLGSRVRGK